MNWIECWVILFLTLSGVRSYYIESPAVHPPTATRQPYVTHAHHADGSVKLYRTPPYRVTSYAAPLIPPAPANYEPIVGITSPVKRTTPYVYKTTWTSSTEDYSEVSETIEETAKVESDESTVEYEEVESTTEAEGPETTTYWKMDTTNLGALSYEGTTASIYDAPPKADTFYTQYR